MNERDLDAEFERIVAGWGDVAPEPTRDRRSPAGPDSGDPTRPADPGDAAAPAPAPEAEGPGAPPPPPPPPAASAASAGRLGLPIAPGAGHTWRGSARPSDDDDAVLETVASSDPDGDHFVPPTDPDLPSAEDDPMFWAIVVGLAGGLALLLYVTLFDRDGSGWWVVTSLTMIGVGFVLLVLRGGTERDPTDDGTRV